MRSALLGSRRAMKGPVIEWKNLAFRWEGVGPT